MDREQLAWAAGFFDGEGSIGCYETVNVQRYKSPRPVIQIAQVHRQPLDRFRDIMGMGLTSGPCQPRNSRSQEYYKYQVNGFERVQHVVCCMWPWLCEQKRNDAHNALRKYLVWANDLTCRRGHPMLVGKGSRKYCPTCRSDGAYKQWVTKREMVQFA